MMNGLTQIFGILLAIALLFEPVELNRKHRKCKKKQPVIPDSNADTYLDCVPETDDAKDVCPFIFNNGPSKGATYCNVNPNACLYLPSGGDGYATLPGHTCHPVTDPADSPCVARCNALVGDTTGGIGKVFQFKESPSNANFPSKTTQPAKNICVYEWQAESCKPLDGDNRSICYCNIKTDTASEDVSGKSAGADCTFTG